MANMNIRPYYEDFDESKNFYRILFRPSFSLQARELTQSQTLLYDQLEKVSTLSDGDKVSSGELTYNNGTVYLSSGTYYINGVAVSVSSSTLTGVTDGKIGFKVLEQFVSPEEDNTLYDNAYGTPNYLAPGAHRYKISVELVKRDLTYVSTDDFIEIFRVKDSKVVKLSSGKDLAPLLTKDFDVDLTSDSSKYTLGLNNGQISIDSNIIDVSDSVDIDKPNSDPADVISIKNVTTNTDSGLWLDIVPSWTPTDQAPAEFDLSGTDLKTVNLSDVTAAGWVEEHNKGTAVVRDIGVNGSLLRLYLTELNITCEFKDIKTVANSAILGSVSDSGGSSLCLYSYSSSNLTSSPAVHKDTFYRQRLCISQTEVADTNAISISDSTIDSDFNLSKQDLEQYAIIGKGGFYGYQDLKVTRNGSVVTFSKNDNTDFEAADYLIFYDRSFSINPNDANALRNQYTKTSQGTSPEVLVDNVDMFAGSNTVFNLSNGLIIPSTLKVYASVDGSGDVADYLNSWKDVTDDFILDDGQRDDVIGTGKISLKVGAPYISGELVTTYSYWKLTTEGRYATVNSYVSPTYDEIPTYKGLRLSDCLDLRRNLSTNVKPYTSRGSVELDEAKLYGNRIDKVVVDQNGDLSVIKGTPYDKLELVPDDSEGLTLYQVNLSGYGYSSNDIKLNKTAYQEVTQQDLNILESRVSELEKIKFTELEVEALNQDLPGLDVIQGLITDSFAGHDKGEVTSPDYSSAIDFETNELRPSHTTRYTTATVTNNAGQAWSSDLTLDKQADVIDISNLKGTDSISASDFSGRYSGHLSLESNVNLSKNLDREQLIFDSEYFSTIEQLPDESKTTSTIWKDWELFWFGSGIQSSPIIKLNKSGNKNIGTNYKPKFNSTNVNFTAKGLKPSTEHTISSSTVGASVQDKDGQDNLTSTFTTDASGSYTGTLSIQSTGLSSSVDIKVSADSSSASSLFHNKGIGEFESYGDIESTVSQVVEVIEDTFFTKLDLYFSKKDDTLPVQVQIRKIKNNTPSNQVLVSQEVLSTNVSTIGATSVVFSEMVHAKPGKYCITVLGSSNYSLFGDKGGVSDLDVGDFFRGSSKVNSFKLKFQLYRASFDISTYKTYTVTTSAITENVNKIYTKAGVNQVIIYQDNVGFSENGNITLSATGGQNIEKLKTAAAGGQVTGGFVKGDVILNGNWMSISDGSVSAWGYLLTDLPDSTTASTDFEVAMVSGTFVGSQNTMFVKGDIDSGSGTPSIGSDAYLTAALNNEGNLDVEVTNKKHIAGIETSNIGSGTVSSITNNYYTFSSAGLEPKVTGYSDASGLSVSNYIPKPDLIYINSNQNIPEGTSLVWNNGVTNVQPNTTLDFTGIAGSTFGFTVTLSTENERYSPMVNQSEIAVALISNNININKFSTSDSVNLSELITGVTGFNADLTIDGEIGTIPISHIVQAYDTGNTDLDLKAAKFNREYKKWSTLEKGDIIKIYSSEGYFYVEYSHLEWKDGQADWSITPVTITNANTSDTGVRAHVKSLESGVDIPYVDTYGTNDDAATTYAKYSGNLSETKLSGSTSMSKYITKEISIPGTANGVYVEFLGDVSGGNEIEIWYNSDNLSYKKLPIYAFGGVGAEVFPTGGTNGYEKISFYTPERIETFNSLQVKLVFKGENTQNPPKIKDLKVFAVI